MAILYLDASPPPQSHPISNLIRVVIEIQIKLWVLVHRLGYNCLVLKKKKCHCRESHPISGASVDWAALTAINDIMAETALEEGERCHVICPQPLQQVHWVFWDGALAGGQWHCWLCREREPWGGREGEREGRRDVFLLSSWHTGRYKM